MLRHLFIYDRVVLRNCYYDRHYMLHNMGWLDNVVVGGV